MQLELSFTPYTEIKLLKDLNIKVAGDQIVIIVGSVGSGKVLLSC